MPLISFEEIFHPLIGGKLVKLDFSPEDALIVKYEDREGVERTLSVGPAGAAVPVSHQLIKFPTIATDPAALTIRSIDAKAESSLIRVVAEQGLTHNEERQQVTVQLYNMHGDEMAEATWHYPLLGASYPKSGFHVYPEKPLFTTF